MVKNNTLIRFSRAQAILTEEHLYVSGGAYVRARAGYDCYQRQIGSDWCFEGVIKGAGWLKCNDEIYQLNAGDLYFMSPQNHYHYGPNDEDPWEKVFIQLRGKFIDSLADAYQLNLHQVFSKSDRIIRIEGLLSLLNEPREIIQAEFPILLHKFIKELTQTNTINKARFTDYIDERIEQSFRLEDMAKHFAYSKNQLLRLFKKEHQTSPYHYLLTKRIEQAIWLLQNTSLSIKEIAYRLQFTDAKHLASTMKKKVSFTPSEIRKRNS